VTTPQMQPVETLTELRLTDRLKEVINEAYVPNDHPILMAYVDEQGRPGATYRGSTIAYSDTQLAVWARNREGGTVKALDSNSNVTLVYREPNPDGGHSRAVITFRGRARIADDTTIRRKVYEEMPQRERDSDAEMNGVAILVDLDSVTGSMPGFRLRMSQDGDQ
jgi:Pyridoxamine 5'-phosphate oxidase